MKTMLATGVLVVTSLVVGCKKGDAAPDAGVTTITSAVVTAPAVPAGACGAGETKIDNAFCVTLPAEMKAGEIKDDKDLEDRPNRRTSFDDSGFTNVSQVWWSTAESYDAAVADAKESLDARKKGGSTGDTGAMGDRGTWLRRLDPGSSNTGYIVKTSKGHIKCTVTEFAKPMPDAHKACKSIHDLGTPAPTAFELPAAPPRPAKK